MAADVERATGPLWCICRYRSKDLKRRGPLIDIIRAQYRDATSISGSPRRIRHWDTSGPPEGHPAAVDSIQTDLSRPPAQAANLLVGGNRRLRPLRRLPLSCGIGAACCCACGTCSPISSAMVAIRSLHDHEDQGRHRSSTSIGTFPN